VTDDLGRPTRSERTLLGTLGYSESEESRRQRLMDALASADAANRTATRASDFVDRIQRQLARFESEAGDDHVAIADVLLPDGRTFIATYFGYDNPSLVYVDGVDQDGREVRLLAPKDTVVVLMSKYRKDDLEAPITQIGFQPPPQNDTAD
jgi:hypothetical protein